MLNSRRWSKAVEGGRRQSETSRTSKTSKTSVLGYFRLHFAEARRVLLRICGMPDYDLYVRHVQACHPGRAVPTERQFFEEYLRARYEGGPTRCC